MKFQSVAILGLGAVGSYVYWGLAKKAPVDPVTGLPRTGSALADLCVIAEGERGEALKKEGMVINDAVYHPVVKTPSEAHGADLLIVTLKHSGLQPALPAIRGIADGHTTIVSLMNGVESEETIGRALGSTDSILWSLVKVSSERKGRSVRFDPEAAIGIIFGERAGTPEASRRDRTDAMLELLEGTGLHHRVSEDIMKEIWLKFRLNIEVNLVQAVLDCGAGIYRDSEHGKLIRCRLGEEVTAIAAAKGINIAAASGSSTRTSSGDPRAVFSTLQDIRAGRHTEIEMFSGTVMRLGQELGIPTPYNECLYHMIRAIEEKNDGLFDYG